MSTRHGAAHATACTVSVLQISERPGAIGMADQQATVAWTALQSSRLTEILHIASLSLSLDSRHCSKSHEVWVDRLSAPGMHWEVHPLI